MAVMLGYNFFGLSDFSDDSTSVQTINYVSASDAIIDEIDISTDVTTAISNSKDIWNSNSVLIAQFKGNLEAGNIGNSGVNVASFKLLRRLASGTELDDILLSQFNYAGGDADFTYTDVTQSNDDLIYTIVPVGENGLDGSVRELDVSSTFTGWWIVDKDTGNTLVFDKVLNSNGSSSTINIITVDTVLNENRTQIDTFNQYPQIYYGDEQYHSFTLSTIVLLDAGQRSGDKYTDILNKFVINHKPVIVKGDNGRIFVANLSNVRASTPMSTWDGFDYIQVSVDVTEIMDYSSYIKGV